ncbi:hypothetical protein GCM10010270_83890 [Streptomyces violaceus]|nr:hypothetical protein GCM10010270_83890 [Streptomyces janthinus]
MRTFSANSPKQHDADRGIPEIPFAAPAGTPAGVEGCPSPTCATGSPQSGSRPPQRPDLHHLITLTGGALGHTVDFTAYALEPGSWLWVRPGRSSSGGTAPTPRAP